MGHLFSSGLSFTRFLLKRKLFPLFLGIIATSGVPLRASSLWLLLMLDLAVLKQSPCDRKVLFLGRPLLTFLLSKNFDLVPLIGGIWVLPSFVLLARQFKSQATLLGGFLPIPLTTISFRKISLILSHSLMRLSSLSIGGRLSSNSVPKSRSRGNGDSSLVINTESRGFSVIVPSSNSS